MRQHEIAAEEPDVREVDERVAPVADGVGGRVGGTVGVVHVDDDAGRVGDAPRLEQQLLAGGPQAR